MWLAKLLPVALSLASFAGARRSKSHSGGGSDDEGGGGDDEGGSGGGSSDGENRCLDSRANQDAEIYDGPTYSSYYNGNVTFRYRLSKVSAGPMGNITTPLCFDVYQEKYNNWDFNYDAVMNIGATTANGALDFLFWELRGFVPWDRGYTGEVAPRREVLRLASLGYSDQRITHPNGTVEEHASSREKSWETEIIPVRNSTGTVSSVNIDTNFVYTPLNDYGAPATNNWIPLEHACAYDYNFGDGVHDTPTFFPHGQDSLLIGPLLTVWLEPNVSDISANITGVGTDTVTFTLVNGKFENLIGGAQPEWPCYSSGGIIFNDPPAAWEPFIMGKSISPDSYWNASGTFEITFEGKLNVSASKPITGYDEAAGFLPQWKSGASRPIYTGASLLCPFISIIFLI